MLEKIADYFSDPRFGRERIFWAISLPAILLILPVVLVVMFLDEIREAFEAEKPIPSTAMATIAPEAVDLAQEQIRLGNSLQAEEILKKARQGGGDRAAADRMLGALLKRQGRFTEAAEAFRAAILLAPVAADYFQRGQCSFSLGNQEDAGRDFAMAAEMSPSNPVYSNRHYLDLISSGKTETVRNRMNLDIQLGVTNTMEGWIVAAAAVALQEGKVKPARDLLSEASARFSNADLTDLLQAPAFDPYRQIPSLAPYLLKSSNGASGTATPTQ
jgi:tetratricopeptide (TPR) repeat protein